MMRTVPLVLSLACVCLLSSCAAASVAPTVTPVEQEIDTVVIHASQTGAELVATLADAYKKTDTAVPLTVQSADSDQGIQALLSGEADIAASERALTPAESDQATFQGLDIVPLVIAHDPLGRPLFHYLKGKPVPGALLHRFLTFELSAAGQAIIEREGFLKITEAEEQTNSEILTAPSSK